MSRPTAEQLCIIQHPLERSHVVEVRAFAGCGKTRMLRWLAIQIGRLHPDWILGYLCFNRSVRELAEEVFGYNVECRTVDSIAIDHFAKNRAPSGYLGDVHIRACLPAGAKHRSVLVGKTIVEYCNSFEEEPTSKHVHAAQRENEQPLNEAQSRVVCDAVLRVMERVYENTIPQITFTIARKFLQLYCPQFPWQCILIDEAQDFNPTMLRIVQKQENTAIVFVGDAFQSIYSFLGTVSVFDEMRTTHRYPLTQCFRFGPNVCRLANWIVQTFYKSGTDARKIRVLPNRVDTVVANLEHADRIVQQLEILDSQNAAPCVASDADGSSTTICFLCRSNSGVLEEASRLVDNADYTDMKLHILGGADSLLERVETFMKLYHQDFAKFIRRMREARQTGQGSVYSTMNFVHLRMQDSAARLRSMIARIRARTAHEAGDADLLVGTVHQSKGREFYGVCIGEDFKVPHFCPPEACAVCKADYDRLASGSASDSALGSDVTMLAWLETPCGCHHTTARRLTPVERALVISNYREEANILYVAITRTIHVLRISRTAAHIIRWFGALCEAAREVVHEVAPETATDGSESGGEAKRRRRL